MNQRWLLAVIGLVAVGFVSPAAFAQMGPPGPPGPPPPLGLMLQGISLTSDQQTAIDAILKSHQQTAQPLLDQLHSEHQALAAKLLSPGQVSLSDLTPLEQQSAQTEQELQEDTLKAALEVKAVLTADQLAQAASNQQKLEKIHAEMHELVGTPPGPPGSM
ncbi:MAG: Spy/CpxP family protein refolding chaperone [Candidatus Binataceae bacterium]